MRSRKLRALARKKSMRCPTCNAMSRADSGFVTVQRHGRRGPFAFQTDRARPHARLRALIAAWSLTLPTMAFASCRLRLGGDGVEVRLDDVRHGEIGRCRDRLPEQGEGIASIDVEGFDGLVEQLRRASTVAPETGLPWASLIIFVSFWTSRLLASRPFRPCAAAAAPTETKRYEWLDREAAWKIALQRSRLAKSSMKSNFSPFSRGEVPTGRMTAARGFSLSCQPCVLPPSQRISPIAEAAARRANSHETGAAPPPASAGE